LPDQFAASLPYILLATSAGIPGSVIALFWNPNVNIRSAVQHFAAGAVPGFAFSHMNLQRVCAWCLAENVASARVLEKLGMKLKKRMRDHQYFKGKWWDRLSYAILYDEWQMQTRGEKLN
jgi:GNAT acetyltransferase-like protein